MSGICGFVGEFATDASAEQHFAALMAAMTRRGPDGESAFSSQHDQGFLGIRWLQTAASEVKPEVVTNEDESLLLVCDGHVFNAEEIAAWLKARGHRIANRHSSELLLHLYEEEGPDGWRRADAQFALAIFDRRRRRLTLARDYFGVRTLYYYADAKGVIFASEIKALLTHPAVDRDLDVQALVPYLTFISVPTPDSLFRNIRKIPSAHIAVWDGTAPVLMKPYWDLLDEPLDERNDEAFYVNGTRELHERSVAGRDVDGPMGALLSGGNDSSANVALLARLGRKPLHTFTCGLAEVEGQPHYSDLEYARQVATLTGSIHHEILISAQEFINTIPKIVDAMDDMVSEPSSVFLYHALQMARNEGLKVVIAGEANDELTCGHREMITIRDRYYQRWAPVLRWPRWMQRAAATAAGVLAPRRQDALRRLVAGEEYFWNFEMAWPESAIPEIVAGDTLRQVNVKAPAETVARTAHRFRATQHRDRDYINYIIYAMMQDRYLGNLMMGKMDLLSSHLGIEVRSPYTEHRYAHFVFNVPARFKARPDVVKYFFKKAIEGLLPNEIIYRPKQGFRAPVVELFEGPLSQWARPILLETGLTRAGYIRASHLEMLLEKHKSQQRDYSTRLWTVMVLNLWYERWITG